MVSCVALMAAASSLAGRADECRFSDAQRASKYIGDFTTWGAGDADLVKQRDAVLCIGSSSMRMWKTIAPDLAPLQIIPRGFGGSTIGDVLLFRDFFLRYEARTIVLYEGDNDLNSSRYTPESFMAQCRAFCDAVWRLRPDTRFYFIAIKPSPSRAGKWRRQQAANALLQDFAASNDQVAYIDVATPMLGEDGKPRPEIFLDDRLHMNSAGYAIWARVVRAALMDRETAAETAE
jgi:lysophospholipase L1-like esterase